MKPTVDYTVTGRLFCDNEPVKTPQVVSGKFSVKDFPWNDDTKSLPNGFFSFTRKIPRNLALKKYATNFTLETDACHEKYKLTYVSRTSLANDLGRVDFYHYRQPLTYNVPIRIRFQLKGRVFHDKYILNNETVIIEMLEEAAGSKTPVWSKNVVTDDQGYFYLLIDIREELRNEKFDFVLRLYRFRRTTKMIYLGLKQEDKNFGDVKFHIRLPHEIMTNKR
uniref:Uncharacterized protein n=1 Tax=Romanomermis culicivorax TaxID=13658 RepID=A0A915HPK5_ROMCU